MNNRNEVKWQPFNAVVNSDDILKELQEKRNIKKMPILSEDETNILENQIIKACHTHEKIWVLYFWNHKFFTKLGNIEYIDAFKNKIYFQDKTSLYFEQLLKIKEIG